MFSGKAMRVYRYRQCDLTSMPQKSFPATKTSERCLAGPKPADVNRAPSGRCARCDTTSLFSLGFQTGLQQN
jgi:hypothetical protein